jgi:tight adherence protein C
VVSILVLMTMLVCGFLAVFLFLRQFFAKETEEQAKKALGIDDKPRASRTILLKWNRPLIGRLVSLTNLLKLEDWRRKRTREILAAGLTEEITADELLAFKFVLGLEGLGLVGVFNYEADWWVWLVLGAMGFIFPDSWLKGTMRRRSDQIVRALPHMVDMLALSVEAGMDFIGSVGRIVAKASPSPLMYELGLMLNELRMGATRADALRNMAYRCSVSEFSSFVAILVQADKLGISIGRVLRAQSDKMRTERFQRAERKGALASSLILFPIILFIMPAVFIVILGPIVLKLLGL